jgi:2-isopropylmalate synthase
MTQPNHSPRAHVDIYDTTLRDGTQSEGFSLSCEDKIRIACRLDQLGMAFIEGGWPGSNPKDVEFFARVKHLQWKHAKIAAFGSTRRADMQVNEDQNLRALLEAETPICTLVGSIPWEIEKVFQVIQKELDHPVGIHAHNDGGLAVANTMVAVHAGAVQVQGTINGYGERCGNANLCAVIPDLELKMGLQCLPEGKLSELSDVSHFVSEVANLSPTDHMPYVGRSAFTHKGGIHVAAMRRNAQSYQHIDPALVGNKKRVVVSELSGRGNLLSHAERIGLNLDPDEDITNVLRDIKELEARGFSFEAADASVAVMLKRQSPNYRPPFELIDYAVNVEHRQGRGTFAEATVKVVVDEEVLHTAADGNGPVNALDAALRKALAPVYPTLKNFQLVDYKVRILDGQNGTAATTRVLIDTRNGHQSWSTVGASTNIIEASWLALADSVEYGLMVAG